jgi:hypothetical protein
MALVSTREPRCGVGCEIVGQLGRGVLVEKNSLSFPDFVSD